MLLLFTIFLISLAGISLVFLIKHLTGPHLLEEKSRRNIDAVNFRPLFAPSDEEMLAFEAEEQKRLAANESEERRQIYEEKLAKLEEIRQNWRASSNRSNTIEVLYSASQIGHGEVYIEVSENVLKAWRAGKIADLSADDLAQLLESHFWLLPAHERAPGVSFRIQQETAVLRRK